MKKLEKLIEEIRTHILNETPYSVQSFPWEGVPKAQYDIEGLPPVYVQGSYNDIENPTLEVEIPFTSEERVFIYERINILYKAEELKRLREEEKQIQDRISKLTES
jgi:hypothetical protein